VQHSIEERGAALSAEEAPKRISKRSSKRSMTDPISRGGFRTSRRIRTGPYIRHTDQQLVELTAHGDGDAYNELVERYQNAVRNRAMGVVKDFQAAEDIAQEAFVKAFKYLPDLDDSRKFAGWLMTIVQHTALDYVRAQRQGVSLDTMREQGYEAPRPTHGLQVEKLEDREEEFQVLDALKDLREDYREIIILKHVEKLSYKEIADRLGMSVSAVGEKLSRVRGLLKRKLTKRTVPRGSEPETHHP